MKATHTPVTANYYSYSYAQTGFAYLTIMNAPSNVTLPPLRSLDLLYLSQRDHNLSVSSLFFQLTCRLRIF